tara:strand:+ start:481 stop:1251 length:771 start_codon:yes stop_codon:yes gene_type:complete
MADNQTKEYKFPTEVIDLPSGGKLYPKESPLSSGKIELKYMTTREEDILTSQNLIKKGIVLDRLLSALIVDKSIQLEEMILGDKNAVMIAARILAYGPEYKCQVQNPTTMEQEEHTFNLTDCPFKELPKDLKISNENRFSMELPASKNKIEFKLLTGKEESLIQSDLKSNAKMGRPDSDMSSRLKRAVLSVDGEEDFSLINTYVDNMLSRDSLALRKEIARITPDIDMKQEVEMGGETVEVNIPLTVEFFWPKATG